MGGFKIHVSALRGLLRLLLIKPPILYSQKELPDMRDALRRIFRTLAGPLYDFAPYPSVNVEIWSDFSCKYSLFLLNL